MSVVTQTSVRPELVEGLPSYRPQQDGRGFDKLSPNGLGAFADPAFRTARLLALLLPVALLAGAWTSQLWGGLTPCEMCHWQRWPHYAALPLAGLAFIAPGKRALVALAAVAIAVSGGIGVYHAGVEWKLWAGHTACTAEFGGGLSTGQLLQQIMAAPIHRCDEAQWRLFGVSLAGWNALFSLGGAIVIGTFLRRSGRA